jgi:hypothetical protein
MGLRIVSKVILLLIALAAATALMVGGMSLLASAGPAPATQLRDRYPAVAIERTSETPTDTTTEAPPNPIIVLVFAGIVFAVASPPVYYRYYRYYSPSN